MPTPSKWVVGVLLAGAAACGAFPLYEEQVWLGSGPPWITVWTGAFSHRSLFETAVLCPPFWALPALALAAAAYSAVHRPRPAAWILALLCALAGLIQIAGPYLFRTERHGRWGQVSSSPLPLFYVAMAAVATALIVLLLHGDFGRRPVPVTSAEAPTGSP